MDRMLGRACRVPTGRAGVTEALPLTVAQDPTRPFLSSLREESGSGSHPSGFCTRNRV